jgi:hypothetical protein
MSRDTISSNMFDALASEQSPEKRMDTRTTPEAFKLPEAALANLSSIGAPDMEILAPPIERINRSRAPGSSAGAREKKGRDSAFRNSVQKDENYTNMGMVVSKNLEFPKPGPVPRSHHGLRTKLEPATRQRICDTTAPSP